MRKLIANRGVDYQEHAAPASLARHVAAVWRLIDAAPAGTVQTIYPDGHCELIVHLASPPECWEEQYGWHEQSSTLFAAQRLSAVRLRAGPRLDCLGVRLRPEASCILGEKILADSRERIVELAAIDAGLSRSLAAAAAQFVAGSPLELWRVLDERFAAAPIDPAVAAAVADIRLNAGIKRIEQVARAGSSLRTLQARFRRCVGLTPKEYARITRLQATLRALDGGDAALSEVAADRGFADQAHATRELRRVTGLAPTQLRAALRADREGDAAIRLAAAFVRGQG